MAITRHDLSWSSGDDGIVYLLGLVILLNGCAINSAGTLLGRVVPADGAWVLQIYAPGAHLRTDTSADAGLTVGFSRREYVFSVNEAGMPSEGWYLFRLPATSGMDALAVHERSIGADVRVGRDEPGVTLGYRSVTASRGPLPGLDSFRSLTFRPGFPQHTCLRTSRVSLC
jgi:hypothetical protein